MSITQSGDLFIQNPPPTTTVQLISDRRHCMCVLTTVGIYMFLLYCSLLCAQTEFAPSTSVPVSTCFVTVNNLTNEPWCKDVTAIGLSTCRQIAEHVCFFFPQFQPVVSEKQMVIIAEVQVTVCLMSCNKPVWGLRMRVDCYSPENREFAQTLAQNLRDTFFLSPPTSPKNALQMTASI